MARERERFARDLHDLLGHSLSVIALKAELAGRLLPARPEQAAPEIGEVEDVARAALVEVRQAVSGYRRPRLEASCRARGWRSRRPASRPRWIATRRRWRWIPRSRRSSPGRCREGATNVIRHSGAGLCTVTVCAGLSAVEVEVIDDGAGEVSGNGSGSGVGSGSGSGVGSARALVWVPLGLRLSLGARRERARGPARARRGEARADRSRRAARRRASAGGLHPGQRFVIRVLIDEDQAMIAERWPACCLSLEGDIEVVAQVSRGDEVVDAAASVRPDVALLDIETPGATGLEAACALRDRLPGCRVLILTTFGRPGYLRRAMERGAAGFLLKEAPATELAAAIRRAVTGERVVDPGLAASALSQGESPVTPREHAVLMASRTTPPWRSLPRRSTSRMAPCANHLSPVMQKRDAAQPCRGGPNGRGRRLALRPGRFGFILDP